MFVLDRREHDGGGGSERVCALLGARGVCFSRKFQDVGKRKKKVGEGQGEGNLDSAESVVGLCCSSRTSTETKIVSTTDY